MTTVQRMTAQEYLANPDETIRSELVDGEVIVHHPTLLHQRVSRDLFVELHAWTRSAAGSGEVDWPIDVLIDERNIFAPDLLWYRGGCAPRRDDKPPYAIPDLAVEVRSPSTWRYDLGSKKSAYERNGLQELWLIDTRVGELLVFRRSTPQTPTFDVALGIGADDTLSSRLLPGFELRLGTLFGT